MSTLTFVRKFAARFVLGLAVLAVPNIVLATGTGDSTTGSDTTHHFSGTRDGFTAQGDTQQNEDGSTTVTFQLSPDTLAKVDSVLSMFGSGCDPSKISTAISALGGL